MKKILIVCLALFLTASLTAQEIDKLGFILEFQKKLELNESQVKKVSALRIDLKKHLINLEAKLETAEVDLKELKRDKEGNLKLIRKKFQELAKIRADKDFAEVKTEVDAYKVMTAEQKQKFGALMEEWHAKMMKREKPKKADKEMMFFHGGGKSRVEKGDHDEDVDQIFEWKSDDGAKKVYKIRKKVKDGEEVDITVDLEYVHKHGEAHEAHGEHADMKKEMNVMFHGDEKIWVEKLESEEGGHKVIKIRKMGGEGEEGHEEMMILKEGELEKIMEAHGGKGEHMMIKIRKKDGESGDIITEIEGLDDEEIKKILKAHKGESVKIIKHEDGKIEVIKGEELHEGVHEHKEGEKHVKHEVIVKKVKKEEKKKEEK